MKAFTLASSTLYLVLGFHAGFNSAALAQRTQQSAPEREAQIQRLLEEGRKSNEFINRRNAAIKERAASAAAERAAHFGWTSELFSSFEKMEAHINQLPSEQDSVEELDELKKNYRKIKDLGLSSNELFIKQNDIYDLIEKRKFGISRALRIQAASSFDQIRKEGDQRAAENDDEIAAIPPQGCSTL